MQRRAALAALLLAGLLPVLPALPALAADAVPPPPQPLRVCANQSLGQPQDGNSAHALLRMTADALPGLKPVTTLLPWQRCLSETAAGHFDAVLAASHSAERAAGLRYPLDARGRPDTARRMFEIGYAMVRRRSSAAHWDGQRFEGTGHRAGEALGAERGYSVVNFARQRGAVVEDRFAQYDQLIESLRLGRIAGVLVNQEAAALLLSDPAWAAGHEISGPVIQPRAYFLAFNPRYAAAHPAWVEQVWREVAAQRRTPAFQLHYSLAMSGGRRRDIQP